MADFPDYIPPDPEQPLEPTELPPQQTPQPRPGSLNRRGSAPNLRGGGVVPTHTAKPLAIPYGENIIEGKVGPIYTTQSAVIAGWGYCVGEAAITGVYIDNDYTNIWPDGTHGEKKRITWPQLNSRDFLEITQYHGRTDQVVDPTLQAFIPNYADTCIWNQSGITIGQCYLVTLQRPDALSSVIVPAIKTPGLALLDPRNSTTAPSTNPALFLYDYVTKPYGANMTADDDSFKALANFCDEQINGKPRFFGRALIDGYMDIDQVLDRLRAIAGAIVRVQGSTVFVEKNHRAASSRTVKVNDIVGGSFRFAMKEDAEAPTRVEVAYTLTKQNGGDLVPYGTDYAHYEDPAVAAGTLPRLTTRVSLPECISHEVAARYAEQQYKLLRDDIWDCSFVGRDGLLPITEGDVITVQHPDVYGGSMLFRVVRTTENRATQFQAIRLELTAYNDDSYIDTDTPGATNPPPAGPDPTNPPAVTGLQVEEVIGPDRTGNIVSRLQIRFDASDYMLLNVYRITILGPGIVQKINVEPQPLPISVFSESLNDVLVTNPDKGELFRVKVAIFSTSNYRGPLAVAETYVLGRFRPPPDIPGFNFIENQDGITTADLIAVTDIGPVGYLLRYATSDTGWDAATTVNARPSVDNRIIHSVFDEDLIGTLFYYAKAVDNVGVLSMNAIKARVNVEAALEQNWRRVKKRFGVDDVASGGLSIFKYGIGDYRVVLGSNATYGTRHGGTVPFSQYSDPWYDMAWHGAPPAPMADIIGNQTLQDFGTDQMRSIRVQGVETYYRHVPANPTWPHEAPDTAFRKLYPIYTSDLYGAHPSVPGIYGPVDETAVIRTAAYAYVPHTPYAMSPTEYVEVRYPVTVITRKNILVQGQSVYGLTQGQTPYTVTFTVALPNGRPYTQPPEITAAVENASNAANFRHEIASVTATGFVIRAYSTDTSFTWNLIWSARGI